MDGGKAGVVDNSHVLMTVRASLMTARGCTCHEDARVVPDARTDARTVWIETV
jgi:hypothetical protein